MENLWIRGEMCGLIVESEQHKSQADQEQDGDKDA